MRERSRDKIAPYRDTPDERVYRSRSKPAPKCANSIAFFSGVELQSCLSALFCCVSAAISTILSRYTWPY